MTFNQIAFKIFKANFRRYLLNFLCSSFTMTVFFIYATLYTNKKMMHSSQLTTISGNVIAPSIVLVCFSVFFIVYSYSSFMKFRKTEYGLLMILGMTPNNIRRILVFENGIMAGCSLLVSLLSGTLLSPLFYYAVTRIVDVHGLRFTLTVNSYLYTIVFFTAIYAAVIACSLLASLRYEMIAMVKEGRRGFRSWMQKPVWGLLGLLMTGFSFYEIHNQFATGDDSVFLTSLLLCYIGVYLMLSNAMWLFSALQGKKARNLLFLSSLKYSFGQTKKTMFAIAVLFSIIILFNTLIAVLDSDSERLARQNYPYHIAYIELYGKNAISERQLNGIVTKGDTPLVSMKKMELIAKPYITLLSDRQVNSSFGSDFHVKRDHFITLHQFVKDDGYEHDVIEPRQLAVDSGKAGKAMKTFVSQGGTVQVLFNPVGVLSNSTYAILNADDYAALKSTANPGQIGVLRLMNFKNWWQTKGIVRKLSDTLEQYNREHTRRYFLREQDDVMMFKPASRIGNYDEAKQATSFLVFLFSFVSILFFGASVIMLHFKLMTEFEREKIKYTKLFKIGITMREMSRMIGRELRVFFFLPIAAGIGIAVLYSYSLFANIGHAMSSARYAFFIGLGYLVVQFIYYIAYKKYYIRKFALLVNRR